MVSLVLVLVLHLGYTSLGLYANAYRQLRLWRYQR